MVDYPLGPIRSGVVESGHYLLRTVGEEIVDMALRLFYKHRGVERRAVRLGALHLPLLAERISGTDAFAESLALCQALESLAEIELFLQDFELGLADDQTGGLAEIGVVAEMVVEPLELRVDGAQRERARRRLVLRLNASLAGHRYLFGLNVPGGVSRDLTPEGAYATRQTVEHVRRELDALGRMLLLSPSHVDRLEGTGILRPEDARAYATVGPVGRASAQDRDVRRDHPYAAYPDVDFTVPFVDDAGDAMARAVVRLEEAHQSVRIINQILKHLPAGPVRASVERLPPRRSGFGWAESARGETLHWISTDNAGLTQRYRVRPASFTNWQAFPLAIPGHNILTDFSVIEQSFGLSYAGNDR